MCRSRRVLLLVVVLVGSVLVSPHEVQAAAGRVELTLVTQRRAPLTAQQTWARELGAAGIRSVRLRSQRSSDKVGIEVRGSKESPIYVVTGTLDSRGHLVLPDRSYRPGEAARVAAWLKDLARHGPSESRESVVAFGLPRSQMVAVHADLSHPISFSTKGLPRAAAARKILRRLKLPFVMDPKVLTTREDDRVTEELQGLSSGTGLACLLRPLGLVLIPRSSPTKGPHYSITTSRGKKEIWSVGWKPGKSAAKVVPKMLDFLSVSLTNVSATKVLDTIAARLKVPVLMDDHALAHHGIDPQKVLVTIPRKRMTCASALDRSLSQAKLKSELRVDEAGKPFLWVTTIKPVK